jgi:hypothetical protein
MFIAYLHQPGGCDYTIGCGNKLVSLTAKTVEEARKELSDLIKENYTGDIALDEVFLYSAEPIEFDMEAVYDEIEEEKN